MKGEHVTTLIFCICGPLAYNWFMSLMKTLFGGKEWPSFASFLIVSIHAFQSLFSQSIMMLTAHAFIYSLNLLHCEVRSAVLGLNQYLHL